VSDEDEDGYSRRCPAPGCSRRVDRVVFACWEHWRLLPRDLQLKTLPGSVGQATWATAEEWLYAHVQDTLPGMP
jgi:hypothetical protein